MLYDFYRPHDPVIFECSSELITKQEFKNECDINNIISQYQQTGIISHINSNSAHYIDLPDSFDYQNSLNLILDAQDAFASLPSVVRDHFKNDPERFLAAFGDESQHSLLREWGLLKPVRPAEAPAVPSPEAGGAAS